jgi:hypothetical protein
MSKVGEGDLSLSFPYMSGTRSLDGGWPQALQPRILSLSPWTQVTKSVLRVCVCVCVLCVCVCVCVFRQQRSQGQVVIGLKIINAHDCQTSNFYPCFLETQLVYLF